MSYFNGDKFIGEGTGILQQKNKIMKNMYLLLLHATLAHLRESNPDLGNQGWPLRGCHPPVSPEGPHNYLDSEVWCRP